MLQQAETTEKGHPQGKAGEGVLSGVAHDRIPVEAPRLQCLVPHLLVLLGFTLLTIVATWPLFPQLGGFTIDKNNALFSVWGMAWQAHALGTDPLNLMNTNVMYPFSGTLAFDELSFTQSVLSAPLYWLLGNPVLSHNIVLFMAYVLCGYTMWLLVRELTANTWAGVVAGAAFAFSFYALNHLAHMTLVHAEWLPLVILSLYKLLWAPSWRWTAALALFYALQALSGHYLAFYTGMMIGMFVLYYSLAERESFSWRFPAMVGVGMLASLVLILPVAVPYAEIQGSFGFKRSLFEVERFSNTLSSFLAVYRGNPIYQALLRPFADPGPWAVDRSAFPGLATSALAVVGLVGASRLRRGAYVPTPSNGSVAVPPVERVESTDGRLGRHALFYAIVAALSAFLSLGPSLQITYAPNSYDPAAIQPVIPLPYVLLYEWVPGFQTMRVVTRIGVLTTLSLSVLAGIGALFIIRRLAARYSGKRSARRLVPAAAVLLALLPVLESWSAPLQMEPIGTRGAVPAVYQWLARQPHTVILEYPMTYYKHGEASVVMENTYQYYSTYHWHKVVNGSLSIKPYAYSALVEETDQCFPCPRSLDALWALGVEYIVVHLDNLSDPQRTDFLWRATHPEAKVVGSFDLVQEFGPDRVYRFHSPRDVSQLADLLPRGSSLLLPSPDSDPARTKDSLVSGGYAAAIGYYLREHTEYGDARLTFGQPIHPEDPSFRPDFALLWANQDPDAEGYLAQNRVWSNEFISLYRRGPGIAGSLAP